MCNFCKKNEEKKILNFIQTTQCESKIQKQKLWLLFHIKPAFFPEKKKKLCCLPIAAQKSLK
jgi:hypothetical protein